MRCVVVVMTAGEVGGERRRVSRATRSYRFRQAVSDARLLSLDGTRWMSFSVPMSLDGKVALVTGGGQGIGAAIAKALAEAGAAVALGARTIARVEAVAQELAAGGARGLAVGLDVTEPEQVRTALAQVESELGPVDLLINNAGISSSAPLAKITLEEWNRILAVNATGTFLMTQAVLPGMLAAGFGRVVNVASVASRVGAPYIAAYTASKHAVLGLTRSVAAEVAGRGVTINALCPGYVDTPMTRASIENVMAKTGRSEEEALAAILKSSEQKRLVTCEEVAHMARSLCAPAADSVNGQAIVIDGGAFLG